MDADVKAVLGLGYLQAAISRLYNPQYYLDYGRVFLERFQAAPVARELSG